MSQTVAFVLPLPVAFALVVLLVVLVMLSAVALSLRKPPPLREPARGELREEADAATFRLGRLEIDGIADLSSPQRRAR
ncbi:hypothetical protein [Massilia consociata]|uniref:Uncharacterized protein n=1 Tax=Massilia consociata TaxID=760117 RepID=A0ABV6FGP7_9BURK